MGKKNNLKKTYTMVLDEWASEETLEEKINFRINKRLLHKRPKKYKKLKISQIKSILELEPTPNPFWHNTYTACVKGLKDSSSYIKNLVSIIGMLDEGEKNE